MAWHGRSVKGSDSRNEASELRISYKQFQRDILPIPMTSACEFIFLYFLYICLK